MKAAFKAGIEFIKKNPSIIFSIALIAIITGIIFFNSYYILDKFQESVDVLLRKKAVLVEDILQVFIADSFENKENLQNKIDEVKSKDSEIRNISILIPNEGEKTFKVVASTNSNDLNQNVESNLNFLAWNNEETGVAYLNSDNSSRFWTVSKVIKKNNERLGLISLEFSLEQYDAFIKDKINKVYWVSIISIFIVLLLVLNHARLFHYAVRVTRLEEVDKMKDEFISMASHELKTPLTSLRGYVELLHDGLRKKESVEETEHYLQNMGISIERLNSLVSDILEVSRLEQNRLPIDIQEIDLLPLMEKIVEEMKILASQKQLDLFYSPVSIQHVMADPERVKQIVINLISNAVKYTPKGKIDIKMKEDEKFVYVTIADTGLGISSEGLKNLFAKFYRVKTDNTISIAGTGLGLWISKQLAIKMGGDIDVESIEEVGSHFTLKLKKA